MRISNFDSLLCKKTQPSDCGRRKVRRETQAATPDVETDNPASISNLRMRGDAVQFPQCVLGLLTKYVNANSALLTSPGVEKNKRILAHLGLGINLHPQRVLEE